MSVTITSNPAVVTVSSSGLQGATGPGYAATSTTSFALAASGVRAFEVQQGLAYSAGARIRATSASDVTKWMEGVVTAYSGTMLTVAMDDSNGSGTFADWNINLTGESGVAGGGATAPAGTGVVKVAAGVFVDPATLLVDVDVAADAAIAWSKLSKSGAVPSDVGAAAASHSHAESDVAGLVSDLAAKVAATRSIATTAPLAGGGDLSADRTLSVASASAGVAGVVPSSGLTAAMVASANVDGAAGTASLRTLGTGAQQAAAGNDSRLSDARTPTAHASSHNAGGGDALAIDSAAATGSLRTLGTSSTSAAAGNDPRLSDARAASSIPDGTPALGSVLATAIAAPATPAAGKGSVYVDSTSKNIAVKDDAGTVKHGVQSKAAVANQFLTAISDAGVVSAAQPTASDVSGLAPVATSGSASDLGTGTLPIARIADGAVTLAKLANLAQDQFIGRTTASTGVPETATVTAAARTVLDDASVSAMVDTLGGASSTGTGGLVRATSPALVTPSLGAATATTINGTAVPSSDTLVTPSGTATLTNKRLSPRTGTTTSSATPTINTDNVDFYGLTAQAVDITSFSTNLSGTPTTAQTLWIAITGTATRAITWGASFASSTVTLPTTTVGTARLDVGFVWDGSVWRCVATA